MISREFSPMEGSTVRVSALFVDEDGNPTDPTSVTITASHVTESFDVTPVPVATGIFQGEFVASAPGTWIVRVEGEGALVVVEESSFKARRSQA